MLNLNYCNLLKFKIIVIYSVVYTNVIVYTDERIKVREESIMMPSPLPPRNLGF